MIITNARSETVYIECAPRVSFSWKIQMLDGNITLEGDDGKLKRFKRF
jgi:hypothetical protein